MAEAGKLDTRPAIILEFDDAVRFFLSASAHSPCFVCGTDSWQIPTRNDNMQLCMLTRELHEQNGERIHTLAVECKRCGFIRQHRAEIILDWLNANPESGDDENGL